MFTFNCFCIDLTMFDTKDQIRDFLKSNKIDKFLDYNNLYDAKTGVFTNGDVINKVWVDSTTFCITAYRTNTESKFTVQYVDYMNSLEPIGYGDGIKQLSTSSPSFETVDEILDKINNYGIDSLTESEKNILNSQ